MKSSYSRLATNEDNEGLYDTTIEDHENSTITTTEMCSSLSVQVLMFYHVLLSCIHFIAGGGLVILKYKYYVYISDIQRAILAPLFVIWAIVEVARLSVGFWGNTRDMVPQMSTFILTCIIQTILVLYFGYFQEFIFPADLALGSIQVAMLTMELFTGYRGLQKIGTKRSTQFQRVAHQELVRGLHED